MTIDTAKLRAETLALIDGTSPGPWRMDSTDPARINGGDGRSVGAAHRCGRFIGPDPVQAANARLIAAAPTLAADTLRLLDGIERLTEANNRLLYVLDGVAGAIDTGRNEPLHIWREQIEIVRAALAEGGRDAQ